MTKAKMIQTVAKRTGMRRKDVDLIVSAIVEIMMETFKAGEKVQFPGLGTFTVRERAAHRGRNPYTGETITVPASRYISFSVGKTMKSLL